MPNWSYNNLTISGPKEDMDVFYQESIKPNSNNELSFRFSNIFPMPEKIKNTISPSSSAKGQKWMNSNSSTVRNDKLNEIFDEEENDPNLIPVENNTPEKCQQLIKEYGSDNWYDWNIKTYGTKWDVEVVDREYYKSDEQFECSFDTAWSPPSNFLENLQNRFKNLDIKLTFELEGSDGCGVFYTNRYKDDVSISYEEDEITYKGSDGREIYYNDDDGEWHYHDDGEICDDYISVNPFNEN
jgi:hypothetical protein